MSRFLGSRPQKKNKYRPEYPLTPKAIPAVRVYVPEKPAPRAAAYQTASQRNALTGELERRAAAETRKMMSEAIEPPKEAGINAASREARTGGSAETHTLRRTYTACNAAPKGGENVSRADAWAEEPSIVQEAARSYVPRHAAPEDTANVSPPEARTEEPEELPAAREVKRSYMPRHAAPEDMDDNAIWTKPRRDYTPRHAAPEDRETAGLREAEAAQNVETRAARRANARRHAGPEPAALETDNAGSGKPVPRVVDESVYGAGGPCR
jgi:hypothetical protein